MENLSDEAVLARWVQNPYYQCFCGMSPMGAALRSQRTGLFPRRIGEQAAEPTVVVDLTVQEKNVTWPTDTKRYHKIIRRCWKLADAC